MKIQKGGLEREFYYLGLVNADGHNWELSERPLNLFYEDFADVSGDDPRLLHHTLHPVSDALRRGLVEGKVRNFPLLTNSLSLQLDGHKGENDEGHRPYK